MEEWKNNGGQRDKEKKKRCWASETGDGMGWRYLWHLARIGGYRRKEGFNALRLPGRHSLHNYSQKKRKGEDERP